MNTVVDTYGWGSEHLGSYYHNGEEVGGLGRIVISTSTYVPTVRKMAYWLTSKIDYNLLCT